MPGNTAIRVNGVSKTFKLPHEKITSLKGVVVNMFRGRRSYEKQQVLRKIALEINQGEFFGIVGRNGSGKSTLLKLLAGIYTPDEGQIELNGKLTPFIELGVGFNPELTGRDNVYLNGALLGFDRKQMEAMYDEIVSFAELEQFMDQKLKNYSSGMQVRLAFSIAVMAKSDILVFDEVLAVGDAAFQRKCLDVFDDYKASQQTIVLVTHDMKMVRHYCSRAALLDQGKILSIGSPDQVADDYDRLNQELIDAETASSSRDRKQAIKAETRDAKTKRPKSSFAAGEDLILGIEWGQTAAVKAVVDIYKRSGEHITSFNSADDGAGSLAEINSASVKVRARISPGRYHFNISLRDADGKTISAAYGVGQFIVTKNLQKAGEVWSGLVPLEHSWLNKNN